MTRPWFAAGTDADRRVVLICAGCRHGWEPLENRTADHRWVLAHGCPDCGDWLYLAELVHRDAGGDLP
jgi:hypothetical protein